MPAGAHPSFTVATIKPHNPAANHQGYNAVGDRFNIGNQSVANLLTFAYSIHPHQIVDAPDSLFHDRYDIEGKTDIPGEPSLHQQQEMIQRLLTDRFALKFHREKRVLPVFAIVIVKGGPKLKSAADPNAQPSQDDTSDGTATTETTVSYTSASIADFILGEQFFMDRPLVDHTGLTGKYDFAIHYTFDETHATDPHAPPGLFTAVQEQLGLKFQPTKAPVDVFVIDHIAPPSAN